MVALESSFFVRAMQLAAAVQATLCASWGEPGAWYLPQKSLVLGRTSAGQQLANYRAQ